MEIRTREIDKDRYCKRASRTKRDRGKEKEDMETN